MFSATISPSKGKGKDGSASTAWRPGWWDFLPLVDTARRPVEWTASSTLVTAHPSHPAIIGRHISSQNQFHFQSLFLPKDIPNYEPPTVLLVHPTEDYVFAYFPSRHGIPGAGAVYQRKGTIDHWTPGSTLRFPSGVVGGRWLPNAREWAVDPSGTPYRLPLQGPRITYGDASLLLIFEDCTAQFVASQNWTPKQRATTKCSLLYPTNPTAPIAAPRPPPEPTHTHKCVSASVGLSYSDTSIYVAFRCRRSPTPPTRSVPFDASVADGELLALPCDLSEPGAETEVVMSQIVVHQRDNGDAVMYNKPLRHIEARNRIIGMSFISYPPARGVKRSPLMFGISTLEMDEYDPTSQVKSSYQLYTVNAPANPPRPVPPGSSPLLVEPGARRTFDGVLSFVFPVRQTSGETDKALFVGLVDASPGASKGYIRKKEVAIGVTRVLNVADLSDNNEWESTPLWSSSQRDGGIGVPVSAGISPNEKQVWTSSFTLWHSHTTLNPLPRRHRREDQPLPEGQAIALAILTRKSTSDIVHSLTQTPSASESAVNILTAAFKILQNGERPPGPGVIGHLMGVALGIYRSLATHCKDEEERQRYTKQWRAAHDMMSMVACLTAFQEASKTETLWPLVKMTSWFFDFLKELLKACVVAANAPKDKPPSGEDDLFGSTPNSPVIKEQFDPIFICLVHPFALTTLSTFLESIQKLRDLVDRSALPDEAMEAGRHVLGDIVDNCPAQIPELLEVLSQANAEASKLDANALIEVVASCQPTPAVRDYLNRLITKITQSKSLLDRSRLFIEPTDLLDGVARLSLDVQPKGKDLDVVTKEVLGPVGPHLRCVRCGGRYHPASTEVDVAWRTWEKRWIHHCVCKGYWENRS